MTIAGVTPSGYNGTFTITAVPTTTSFTYTLATDPGTYVSGGTATVPAALTEGGTTTTEGYLTDSADGHTLSIAGYNQAPGGSTSSVTRTIGVVGPDGVVDTSTQAPSSTGSVRVAISADGLGFWVATSTGVRYVPFGNNRLDAVDAGQQRSDQPDRGRDRTKTRAAAASARPASCSRPPAPAPSPTACRPSTARSPSAAACRPPAGNSITVSPAFPTARDAFNNFPTHHQFAVSPDGNTIFIADSRTDCQRRHPGVLPVHRRTTGRSSATCSSTASASPPPPKAARRVTITTSAPTNVRRRARR